MKDYPQPPARLLGLEEAAGYFGISPRTFERHWRNSQLPGPHRIGRRLVWDRALLDRFADVLSGLADDPNATDPYDALDRD